MPFKWECNGLHSGKAGRFTSCIGGVGGVTPYRETEWLSDPRWQFCHGKIKNKKLLAEIFKKLPQQPNHRNDIVMFVN